MVLVDRKPEDTQFEFVKSFMVSGSGPTGIVIWIPGTGLNFVPMA